MNSFRLAAILLAAFSALPALATVPREKTELPIEHAFIPRAGFDDNDWVETVIHGTLPSPCVQPGMTRVLKQGPAGARVLRLVQEAWIRRDGPCGSGDLIDLPTPFTRVVSLGHLEAGAYVLATSFDQRPFEVASAPSLTIDSLSYAPVTQVEAPDVVEAGVSAVVARIRGVLTSTCQRLPAAGLKASRMDDVFVVLPVLTEEAGPCEPARKPFVAEVRLDFPGPGTYLLHVRSRDGASRNHVIESLAP